MPITSLRIVDFRNLAQAELSPCTSGLNIISGDNGSGKTSLLEAIHYLGHGRSFRTSSNTPLIRQTTDKFSIYSQIVTDSERVLPIGAERDMAGAGRFRVGDKDLSSVADIAAFIPMRVINSHSHQLFESGPVYRRKYLDWGLFYQSEPFFNIWRSFERALKQRNAILREKRNRNELDAWSSEVAKHGVAFDRERRQYVALLKPYLLEVVNDFMPVKSIDLAYQPGWDDSVDYEAVLMGACHDEYRIGHTHYGPHRADLDITIDGVMAKQILSRGQQKLLICAMILAQGIMLAKYVNKGLIYLIDDLPSELDSDSRKKLISLLAKQQTQIFITAIERDSICDFIEHHSEVPLKVFHVEHGQVQEVV